MKAAVIHSPGVITCDTVDDPIIKDQNDIILRVTSTAICGSDLHMYSGGIPKAFSTEAALQSEKDNNAAGTRARKSALEMSKLFKEFRKVSVEETKK